MGRFVPAAAVALAVATAFGVDAALAAPAGDGACRSRADAAALLRGKVGSRIVLGGRFAGKDGTKSLTLRELIRN